MTKTTVFEDDDDMPNEVDFSKGVRGKFYRPNAKLNLPIYLDETVQQFLAALAAKKGVQISDVANDLLKKDIALFESFKL
ncbi:hypothetical protein [Methyloglobulus sp.]|uniref:hypothetical protein n=1 Tax=Methyloglobulus sp. TaxID=2518622 RepID=UPI0032B85993